MTRHCGKCELPIAVCACADAEAYDKANPFFEDKTNPVEEYRAAGKEIVEVQKIGGLSIVNRHYADAVDEEAAIAIAYALNSVFLAKLGPNGGKQC
jgi:hypothetical protein